MAISPGWYPDPAEPSTQRYWDGEGWIGAALPVDAPTPDGPPAVEAEPEPVLPPAPAPRAGAPVTAPPPMPLPPGKTARQVLTAPVRPHGLTLATPGARMTARLIDIGVVLGLNIVVNGWFVYLYLRDMIPFLRDYMRASEEQGSMFPEIARPEQLGLLQLAIVFIAVALWFAYEVPATAHRGQTLGKRLTNIKVVAVDNLEPIGVRRAWRRWNPLGLPLLLVGCCGPFLVLLQIWDVVFVLADKMQRMALHDRSAGTYVVQLPASARSESNEPAGSKERNKR